MKTNTADVPAYTTRDGSLIRELMHPSRHGNQAQSLAQSTVAAGGATRLHRHHRSEEIYHILSGSGRLTLGAEEIVVASGDTVCIPPGTPHCIRTSGTQPLVFLCACAPAYAHEDTELL